MLTPNRILIPVDFSAESTLALDWAIKMLQRRHGVHIELCHILPQVVPLGPEAVAFEYATTLDHERRTAVKKLRDLQERIPPSISSSYVMGQGDIAKEIERLCGEMNMDLVVMTTRGRRGLSRVLHGSTTEATARVAPCPVLVLHLNDKAREIVGATSDKCGEGWK